MPQSSRACTAKDPRRGLGGVEALTTNHLGPKVTVLAAPSPRSGPTPTPTGLGIVRASLGPETLRIKRLRR